METQIVYDNEFSKFIGNLQNLVNKYTGQYLSDIREVNYNLPNGENKTEYLIEIQFTEWNANFNNELELLIENDKFFITNKDIITLRQEYVLPKNISREPDSDIYTQIITISIALIVLYFLIF